ncbi:MAG TPA: YdeI/OmpD-associated family protein [Thermomicrobiales bacterium]
MTETKGGLPILAFPSQAAWEEWLAAQPPTARGLWLKLAKKDTGIATVSQVEAVESALCYGWIDGQGAKFDDAYWLIRFTPRGPQSRWSAINRDRAVKLIESGRMQPGGLREVERARADGRWERAYAPPSTATPPDDLAAALAANLEAQRFFDALDSTNRYAIIYRVGDAKKPETRARRIEQYVAMLTRGETIYPRKGG